MATENATVELMRAHYDSHASTTVSATQARAARASGAAAALKRYHNNVKRALINYAVRRAKQRTGGKVALADLCCGRGGDIQKWLDAGVSEVLGYDLSPGEIEEAKKRWEETMVTWKPPEDAAGPPPQATFAATDQLGQSPVSFPRKYDVVCCMFAVHYFWASESSFRAFLGNVASALSNDGLFIGACPLGTTVLETLDGKNLLDTPMLVLEARWPGAYHTFGSAYTCAITDTVTDGGQGSTEFMVFRNAFEAIAREVGLQPVTNYDEDDELEALLDPSCRSTSFKQFAPGGDSWATSHESLKTASRLNATFVLRKGLNYSTSNKPDDDDDDI